MATCDYEFVCVGRLSPLTVSAIRAHRPRFQNDRTTVVISIRDPAELHGTIAQFEALGIDLVEMRQLAPFAPASDAPPMPSRDRSNSSSEDDPEA